MGFTGYILLAFLIANVLDYITGSWASGKEGTLSSEKGKQGIKGKVICWLIIGVALLIDLLIIHIPSDFGVTIMSMPIVTPVVSLWYVLNEMLSILEKCYPLRCRCTSVSKKDCRKSIKNS